MTMGELWGSSGEFRGQNTNYLCSELRFKRLQLLSLDCPIGQTFTLVGRSAIYVI
jgi:hypothetical protein